MRPEPKVADHSYEEIRDVAVALLSGREKSFYTEELSNYDHLASAISEVLVKRADSTANIREIFQGNRPRLSYNDESLCSEVFWNLFREGIITLGWNSSNREYPYFRVSHFGKKLLVDSQVYFFHDVSTYEKLLNTEVPAIDPTTLVYAKEAMQAFRSGCILSASVMLGVATEHTFDLLIDKIEANPAHTMTYAKVYKERQALTRTVEFWKLLQPNLKSLPADTREGLALMFPGIQEVIRNFRNDSGHPTGKIISREQCYVLLNLFVPYAKKMYQLIDHFK